GDVDGKSAGKRPSDPCGKGPRDIERICLYDSDADSQSAPDGANPTQFVRHEPSPPGFRSAGRPQGKRNAPGAARSLGGRGGNSRVNHSLRGNTERNKTCVTR